MVSAMVCCFDTRKLECMKTQYLSSKPLLLDPEKMHLSHDLEFVLHLEVASMALIRILRHKQLQAD